MKEMENLCFADESVSEKDARWPKVATKVAEKMSHQSERKPSGIRDHMKALFTTCKSMAMMYSQKKKNPADPEEIDEQNDESVQTYQNYCKALYEFMLTLSDQEKKDKDINLKWWNEELFTMIRVAILNQGKKAKEIVREQKNKFDGDQAAKAQLIEENKKKREAEDQEIRENAKKVALAVVQQGETTTKLVNTLGEMVQCMSKMTTPNGSVGVDDGGANDRFMNLESGLAAVKDDVSSMNNKLDQILGALAKK